MKNVRLSDSRYRHREVAARLLFLEYSRDVYGKNLNTKKPYLDDMVRKAKDGESRRTKALQTIVSGVLNTLSGVFVERDYLLRSQSIVPVVYLTAQLAVENETMAHFQRHRIADFYTSLETNRTLAEGDISKANFELLEFIACLNRERTMPLQFERERASWLITLE